MTVHTVTISYRLLCFSENKTIKNHFHCKDWNVLKIDLHLNHNFPGWELDAVRAFFVTKTRTRIVYLCRYGNESISTTKIATDASYTLFRMCYALQRFVRIFILTAMLAGLLSRAQTTTSVGTSANNVVLCAGCAHQVGVCAHWHFITYDRWSIYLSRKINVDF